AKLETTSRRAPGFQDGRTSKHRPVRTGCRRKPKHLSAQHKPVWGHEAIPLFYLVWADFIPKEIVDSFGGGVMGLYCRMALLVGVVSEWLLFIHGLARSSGIAATLAPYPLWALFDLETVARGLITVLVVPL